MRGAGNATVLANAIAPDPHAENAHKLGGLGSALGHSVLGSFGKKKPPPPPPPPAQTAPDPVLMEMTTKKTNFSTGPVPSSTFAIPAGYKQISVAQQGLARRQGSFAAAAIGFQWSVPARKIRG
jgi:hypothetical protein